LRGAFAEMAADDDAHRASLRPGHGPSSARGRARTFHLPAVGLGPRTIRMPGRPRSLHFRKAARLAFGAWPEKRDPFFFFPKGKKESGGACGAVAALRGVAARARLLVGVLPRVFVFFFRVVKQGAMRSRYYNLSRTTEGKMMGCQARTHRGRACPRFRGTKAASSSILPPRLWRADGKRTHRNFGRGPGKQKSPSRGRRLRCRALTAPPKPVRSGAARPAECFAQLSVTRTSVGPASLRRQQKGPPPGPPDTFNRRGHLKRHTNLAAPNRGGRLALVGDFKPQGSMMGASCGGGCGRGPNGPAADRRDIFGAVRIAWTGRPNLWIDGYGGHDIIPYLFLNTSPLHFTLRTVLKTPRKLHHTAQPPQTTHPPPPTPPRQGCAANPLIQWRPATTSPLIPAARALVLSGPIISSATRHSNRMAPVGRGLGAHGISTGGGPPPFGGESLGRGEFFWARKGARMIF